MWLRFGNQKWQAFFRNFASGGKPARLSLVVQRPVFEAIPQARSVRQGNSSQVAPSCCATRLSARACHAPWRRQAAAKGCAVERSRGVGRRARSATRGAFGTALDPRFVTVRNMIISVTMCSDMLFKNLAEKWLRIRNQKWQGFFLKSCTSRLVKINAGVFTSSQVCFSSRGDGS